VGSDACHGSVSGWTFTPGDQVLDALWMQRLMVFVDQLNDKFSARYWRSAYYYNNPISSRAWRRACKSLRNSEMESITFKRGIVGSEGPY
jgi:hypothetical protein